MFYEKRIDQALRFGDVIGGVVLTHPNIKNISSQKEVFNIDINISKFSVVMTPCCSIGDGTISLSPLIKVRSSFFDNPYYLEDLTRINREMEPQQAVPPNVWEMFPDEEKQKRLREGHSYALLNIYVYEKHDLYPKYEIHRRGEKIETNYYMIDFKNIYKLDSDEIRSPEKSPISLKYLQLSIRAREELRNKISSYFARPAKEDLE